MFTLDEKIVLVELITKMLTIEEANLRNLRTVKFQSFSKANKLTKKVMHLRSIRSKLESIK